MFGTKAAGLAAILLSSGTVFGGFAESVLSYNAGTGAAPGYNNISTVLGEPSRVTPGQFGGPVDPFNSAYLPEQLLSIGTGGSLTVQFASPILNSEQNPFGLDFTIFGNAGFVITNGDFTGGGITDGSLYGANPGETRVSVSADNITYYQLSPSVAPTVDKYFPTDGSGDFSIPINPVLAASSFAGKDLSGTRELYGGSAGGASFDLAWARDSGGNPVDLASARFVRVEVLSGVAEIDGFSAVPEPAPLAFTFLGITVLLLGNWSSRRQCARH
jgi:hypothetical protein